MMPGLSAPLGLIGLAEKGYLSVELKAEAPGGHSSMPPAQTAVGIVSAAVRELERHPMPGRLQGPTRLLFEHAGPETRLPLRAVFANLWLLRPVLEWQLADTPATNALLRTTTAATMIEGGVKENLLPASARAVVNFRIRPGDTTTSVLENVRATVHDPRIALRALAPANEPSRVSSVESAGFEAIARSIRQTFPDAVVAPSLVLGATDSRYYAGIGKDVYRFLPVRFGPDDLARAHGTNERIRVEGFAQAVKFYARLIRNSSPSSGRRGGLADLCGEPVWRFGDDRGGRVRAPSGHADRGCVGSPGAGYRMVVVRPMTIAKAEVLDLVRALPEEVDLEELIYRLYLREKLAAAEQDVASGRTLSMRQVREAVSSWTRSGGPRAPCET
jgi:hypothetical protein